MEDGIGRLGFGRRGVGVGVKFIIQSGCNGNPLRHFALHTDTDGLAGYLRPYSRPTLDSFYPVQTMATSGSGKRMPLRNLGLLPRGKELP